MKLSIITPTLNEAAYLATTIEKANENSFSECALEFIVVDSGSKDGTREIAKSLGAKLLDSSDTVPGKAHALDAGAEEASGDVYLFLDADTILPAGYDVLIERAFNDPAVVGGAFEFSLEGPEFGLRVVELINRVRYRIRQRYYGDQAVFVRAEVFNRVGGYPDLRLLESAHFCRILRSQGKLELISRPVKTSSRRFIKGGIYKVLLSDIKIWFLDLLGINVDSYAEDYWQENKVPYEKS